MYAVSGVVAQAQLCGTHVQPTLHLGHTKSQGLDQETSIRESRKIKRSQGKNSKRNAGASGRGEKKKDNVSLSPPTPLSQGDKLTLKNCTFIATATARVQKSLVKMLDK